MTQRSDSRTVDTLRSIATEEVSGDTRLRMLTAALACANWVSMMMVLLVVGDLQPVRPAFQLAVSVSGAVFGAHFVLSRAPAIARAVLALLGSRV